MQAVILAGGLGRRLRPFTQVIPKSLLPLGERTLMEIQISALRAHGVTEIFVATNYLSDLIEAFLGDGSKFGVKIRVSREDKPLGTCGPLGLLRRELQTPFLAINGDILTRLDFGKLVSFALNQKSFLTVGTKIITTPFRFGNVVVDDSNQIVDVNEKPELKLEIVSGIYCFKKGVFPYIPENEYYGMDSLIKTLLEAKQPISRYLIREYWLDIGQVEDYSKAREEYDKNYDDSEATRSP